MLLLAVGRNEAADPPPWRTALRGAPVLKLLLDYGYDDVIKYPPLYLPNHVSG